MNSGNKSSKIPIPSAVNRPTNPIKPGSVLDGLITSTSLAAARCASRFSGNTQDTTNHSSSSAPCSARGHSNLETGTQMSKRPTQQAEAFKCSLRKYNNQSRTTPSTRVTSPSPTTTSRPATTAIGEARTAFSKAKLNSYKERYEKSLALQRSNTCKAILVSKPPTSPKGIQEQTGSSSIPKPTNILNNNEIRPVRLAYGIKGIQKPQPTVWQSVSRNPLKIQEDSHPKSSLLGPGQERFIRMLHTREIVKIERTHTQTCRIVTKDRSTHTDEIIQSLTEDKACQSSLTSINLTEGISNSETDIINMEHNNLAEGLNENSNHSRTNRCKQSTKSLKKLLIDKEKANRDLENHIRCLKNEIDTLSKQNEFLELQFFETREEKLRAESARGIPTKEDESVQTDWIPTFESTVPPELLEKLKFPLESFITTQFPSMNDTGDANDGEDSNQKLKIMRVALAAREGLLCELKGKLKKGYKLLQRRFDSLQSTMSANNNNSTIESPEVDFVLNSYRRFVRFISNYIEQSVAEIKKFDEMNIREVEGGNSQYFHEKTIEINGVLRFGIFIPLPTLSNHIINTESPIPEYPPQEQDKAYEKDFIAVEILETLLKSVKSDISGGFGITEHTTLNNCSESELLQQNNEDDTIETVEVKPLQFLKNNSDETEKENVEPLQKSSVDPVEGLAAAKAWIDRHPSPMTTFILDPTSFSKIFSRSFDTRDTPHVPQSLSEESESSLSRSDSTLKNHKSSTIYKDCFPTIDSNITTDSIWRSTKFDTSFFDISEMTLNDPNLPPFDINGNS